MGTQTIDSLIEKTTNIPRISTSSSSLYRENIHLLTEMVNVALLEAPDMDELIGHNQRQVMFDNHQNHAFFMSTVFILGDYELLVNTVAWVYTAYHNHGFKYEYFKAELLAWKNALDLHFNQDDLSDVQAVYQWMLDHHSDFIKIADSAEIIVDEVEDNWLEIQQVVLKALLAGDHQVCLDQFRASVNQAADLSKFYLQVLQPAMYEIGRRWEKNEVTVAQEHLASAIVQRLMASSVQTDMDYESPNNQRVLIAASPNEYHQIGAAMLADLMEHQGWDVRFMGADLPQEDLIQFVDTFKPQILALSATMPFNLLKVQEIITKIKEQQPGNPLKIMVGGLAFSGNDTRWQELGADGFAPNAQAALELANQWLM